MWLMTNFGFFSIVQKEPDTEVLTVRARTRGDLDRLRTYYVAGLGTSSKHGGSDYPWRASVDRDELSKGMTRIFGDLHYPNFKDEVAVTLGAKRAKRYGQVWSALNEILEDLPEPDAALDELASAVWPKKPNKGMKVAYGGIVFNREGRVLLRKVRGDYDGYVWSFAKGLAAGGESASETARREVQEETGVRGTILVPLPGDFLGGTSVTRYFLMAADERNVACDYECTETEALRWATVDEARSLISLTSNGIGRGRDLAALEAASRWLPAPAPLRRPISLRTDWKRRPFPSRRAALSIDLHFTTDEMGKIIRGFVPGAMEEKWFDWFEDGVLRLNRSWTGAEIYRVFFEPEGAGWCARRAEVSRRSDEYGLTDDAADAESVSIHVRSLLDVPNEPSVDGFVYAMQQAMKPNYLGSPAVVGELVDEYINVIVSSLAPDADDEAMDLVDVEAARLEEIFSGQDETFTVLPGGWNAREQLGESLVKFAALDPRACLGLDLPDVIGKVLRVVVDIVRAWGRAAGEIDDLTARLDALRKFVRDLFLGTTSVTFPGLTLTDMAS